MTPSQWLDRHFNKLFLLGVIAGTLLSVLYAEHQVLRGDQNQMIYKGYLGALQGEWLAYGNFASTIGNLPGYLSALVVGVPLLLWDNPWAPMLFLIGLRLVAFLLLDSVVKRAFDSNIRLVFMLLFWLSPWVLYDSLMYNPAYLCLFAALHLWTAFRMQNQKSFILSFLHIASVGMAMQLHFSWPILAVASVYIFYRQMIKVSWPGVIAAILATAASLFPYFQELLTNEAIVEESDRYIGYGLVHVYPVLKSLLYWLRYGSFLFSNRVIADSGFDWVTSIDWLQMVVQYAWKAITFPVGIATVVISAKFNWRTWKFVKPLIKKGQNVSEPETWLIMYSFAILAGILISACLSPITFSYWHLIITFPFALFPVLREINLWKASNNKRFGQILLAATAYLLVLNLLAAHDSQKYSYSVSYQPQVEQYLTEQGFR